MAIMSRLIAGPLAALVGRAALATGAGLIVLAALPGTALAQGASPWAESFHSRARLLAGSSSGSERWAAVEIVLDRGFKTYWRQPGESGLPPRFDWAGSANLSGIDLHWPAPSRTEDAAGVTHTYSDRLVLPLRVTATDPARPVGLRLTLDYGVCKDICIPARADLELKISGEGPHGALIREALARVPRPQALGAEGPLSIKKVERVGGDKPIYQVRVRAPDGAALFADPPENWYVSTSKLQPGQVFTVTIDEKPSGAAEPVPVRLILAAGEQAIETQVDLD